MGSLVVDPALVDDALRFRGVAAVGSREHGVSVGLQPSLHGVLDRPERDPHSLPEQSREQRERDRGRKRLQRFSFHGSLIFPLTDPVEGLIMRTDFIFKMTGWRKRWLR